MSNTVRLCVPHCNGGDEFVQETSVQCNVQNCCLTVCDENSGEPIGVEVVQAYDLDVEESNQRQELKYKIPEMSDDSVIENLERMTWKKLDAMVHYLPRDECGRTARQMVISHQCNECNQLAFTR